MDQQQYENLSHWGVVINMISKRIAIYGRFQSSSTNQDVTDQMEILSSYAEIRGYKIYQKYIDWETSNEKENGLEFSDMMNDAIRNRKFNVVMVWSFDCFFRTISQFVMDLNQLFDRNLDFISFTENVDTSTPIGYVYRSLISQMARMENKNRKQQIKLTLEKDIKEGKIKVGRSSESELSEETKQAILTDHQAGLSIREIARIHRINPFIIRRLIQTLFSNVSV